MNPSEFLDVLQRLLARLQARKTGEISGQAERKNIRSVIGAWFAQYRPAFVAVIGEGEALAGMDEKMQELLKLASDDSARRTVVRLCKSAIKKFKEHLLIPLSRGYWSLAPQRSPAGYDKEVAAKLEALDADLAQSYSQVGTDIMDDARLSFRGTAAELREVLTDVLHTLAPTEKVQATDWYKEARRSGGRKEPTPTRAERTRFILRSRALGSAVSDNAESYMETVEERLGDLVNATYRRGSAATHVGAEREELVALLPYVNALLRELLPRATERRTPIPAPTQQELPDPRAGDSSELAS